MDKLVSRNMNWNLFLTHPLELIKLDSSLKLKATELTSSLLTGKYHQDTSNWNDLIELEIRKHLRLIHNFRCFLQVMARDVLYFHFPDSHHLEIKQSWSVAEEDRFRTLSEMDIPMGVTTLNDNTLFLLMSAACDYDKTKKLFRDALFRLFQKLQLTCNRQILDYVIEKVNFRLRFDKIDVSGFN